MSFEEEYASMSDEQRGRVHGQLDQILRMLKEMNATLDDTNESLRKFATTSTSTTAAAAISSSTVTLPPQDVSLDVPVSDSEYTLAANTVPNVDPHNRADEDDISTSSKPATTTQTPPTPSPTSSPSQDAGLDCQSDVTKFLITSPTRCSTLGPCDAVRVPVSAATSWALSTSSPASTPAQDVDSAVLVVSSNHSKVTQPNCLTPGLHQVITILVSAMAFSHVRFSKPASAPTQNANCSVMCSNFHISADQAMAASQLSINSAPSVHMVQLGLDINTSNTHKLFEVISDVASTFSLGDCKPMNMYRHGLLGSTIHIQVSKRPKPPWLLCAELCSSWYEKLPLISGFLLEVSPWYFPAINLSVRSVAQQRGQCIGTWLQIGKTCIRPTLVISVHVETAATFRTWLVWWCHSEWIGLILSNCWREVHKNLVADTRSTMLHFNQALDVSNIFWVSSKDMILLCPDASTSVAYKLFKLGNLIGFSIIWHVSILNLFADPSKCRVQWKPPWVSYVGGNIAGHCYTNSFIMVLSGRDDVAVLLMEVQARRLITCLGIELLSMGFASLPRACAMPTAPLNSVNNHRGKSESWKVYMHNSCKATFDPGITFHYMGAHSLLFGNVSDLPFYAQSCGLLHTLSYEESEASNGSLVLFMSKFEDKDVSAADQRGMHSKSLMHGYLFLWEWDDSKKSVQAPLLLKSRWPPPTQDECKSDGIDNWSVLWLSLECSNGTGLLVPQPWPPPYVVLCWMLCRIFCQNMWKSSWHFTEGNIIVYVHSSLMICTCQVLLERNISLHLLWDFTAVQQQLDLLEGYHLLNLREQHMLHQSIANVYLAIHISWGSIAACAQLKREGNGLGTSRVFRGGECQEPATSWASQRGIWPGLGPEKAILGSLTGQ